ncbi:MAG: acetyl-CoA carboxylase, carboxyltransferase subunit beta [Saprospiraceae bacterium]|nr:acetyl-CoA carboxylase, carboxyltransferase subunit beta [Saprospiraceae bacterium]
MSWFKRIKDGIITKTSEKREAPDGLWTQCPKCKHTISTKDIVNNYWVCTNCDHHHRIGPLQYFYVIYDGADFQPLFSDLQSVDFLKFKDLKTYTSRLSAAEKKGGSEDAMSVAHGKVNGEDLVIAAMNFKFIGGSMGSVVGEKIARAIDYAIENRCAFMIISQSGGARMMESAFSLMQMAKSSAKLTRLAAAKLPYFSLMTDPTTGGVTASFAMLGDVNMAEPDALIGFAGPRVIKETIRRDLPEGFQRSEFLLEKGFLDFIVHRKALKQRLSDLIKMLKVEQEVSA